ncbi:lytic transglycosylase domain-containing protein [Halorussus gelatinilyticus]|uniref:Lytic transglycosylase domain-containing protein n=1 Tax=Halorussus gelatinilyticus TaxID=2937524 RepID=A0A8U0IEC4_9EURY|nr:lytic transglycosylase domain-containing protein [Halorussus gelatinilyticus]UPV99040.1 lytic transglycosylase domain-containing protein [Halorussus gelatinilyticus]
MHSRRDMLKRIGATGATAVAVAGLTGSAAAAPGSIPSNYLTEYRATGDAYGIDWTYLAGVGWVETQHGQYEAGCDTSSAGAKGPMQFMPSTWDAYGVDGDGDGYADICNYEGAIPSAANYLTSSGAPENWDDALYAYNHSWSYVSDVKDAAAYYRDAYGGGGGGTGFSQGDRVTPTVNLNTRKRPGTESTVVATVSPDEVGEIVNGPTTEDGYTWWGMHWLDRDVWGWSVETYLDSA